MSRYKDIDLLLENNIYNDFSVLTDELSVKNTLYNNLLVDDAEIPFENKEKLDVLGLLHEVDDILISDTLEDSVLNAVGKDKRIKKVNNISHTFNPNSYLLTISLNITVEFSGRGEETIDISLLIRLNQ